MKRPLITFLVASCLFLSALNVAQAQQPSARIKVDIDRQIGEVDPLLFGNFSEHLGRMIYGGIYEEGSPLSDANAPSDSASPPPDATCWQNTAPLVVHAHVID